MSSVQSRFGTISGSVNGRGSRTACVCGCCCAVLGLGFGGAGAVGTAAFLRLGFGSTPRNSLAISALVAVISASAASLTSTLLSRSIAPIAFNERCMSVIAVTAHTQLGSQNQ